MIYPSKMIRTPPAQETYNSPLFLYDCVLDEGTNRKEFHYVRNDETSALENRAHVILGISLVQNFFIGNKTKYSIHLELGEKIILLPPPKFLFNYRLPSQLLFQRQAKLVVVLTRIEQVQLIDISVFLPSVCMVDL